MPLLNSAYENYKSRGFELLAISGDDPADRERVVRFGKEHKLTFPILHDETTAQLYNVIGYPGNIFIDRDGKIRYSTSAFPLDGRLLETVLSELLK